MKSQRNKLQKNVESPRSSVISATGNGERAAANRAAKSALSSNSYLDVEKKVRELKRKKEDYFS